MGVIDSVRNNNVIDAVNVNLLVYLSINPVLFSAASAVCIAPYVRKVNIGFVRKYQ